MPRLRLLGSVSHRIALTSSLQQEISGPSVLARPSRSRRRPPEPPRSFHEAWQHVPYPTAGGLSMEGAGRKLRGFSAYDTHCGLP